MEKVTRHLLSGDRTLDLWTYPEATPADRVEGPALDRARIRLLLKKSHGLPPLQPKSSPLPPTCRRRRLASCQFRTLTTALPEMRNLTRDSIRLLLGLSRRRFTKSGQPDPPRGPNLVRRWRDTGADIAKRSVHRLPPRGLPRPGVLVPGSQSKCRGALGRGGPLGGLTTRQATRVVRQAEMCYSLCAPPPP